MNPEQAYFAGFMHGTDVTLVVLERALKKYQPVELPAILKMVQDDVALEVAGRMEDAGVEPAGGS